MARLPEGCIWRVSDYKQRTVSLYVNERDHIINNHPDMGTSFDKIYDSIKTPDAVYQSSQSTIREVYFKSTTSPNPAKPLVIKTIVEYDNYDDGKIITSFRQPKIGGGISDQLYPKG